MIIAGAHDGYFKTDQAITDSIQQTNPDIVFVALGFPKQEKFIYQSYSNSHAIWMGVGGSFDVLAGKVKRAPIFLAATPNRMALSPVAGTFPLTANDGLT